MKTTNEVIIAVRDGSEVSQEELRYAVRNLEIWQNGVIFVLARAITENPISEKTKRDLQRSYDNARTGNAAPLDVRLKGSSYEPGISRDERTSRFASKTADVAGKLVDVLTSIQESRR